MEQPNGIEWWQSRRVLIGAVAGLAVALGGGGAIMALDSDDAPRSAAVADRPVSTPAPEPSSPEAQAGRPQARPHKSSALAELPKSAQERVKAAREAAEKDGVEVQHPLPQRAQAATMADPDSAKVTTTGSLKKDRGTMRIVTVQGDLTGQRELAWVAGGITDHGPASCSQTFKLSNEAKPAKRKNLLVCWRTSAAKSVVTVTVDLDGKPSVSKSLAVIDKQWRNLRY